jgi:periplasmic divalent cation tolerance protein
MDMSAQTDVLVVVTACGSQDEALALARSLVERRLAACAQIGEIRSLYAWKGEICEDGEWRLEAKTLRSAWPAVEAAIRAGHPYETPEILAIEAVGAHGPYRDWIAALVGGEADASQLDALEMRIAHQDRTIADLNDVVTALWDKIAELERRLAQLREEFQSMALAGDAPEPPPPHY